MFDEIINRLNILTGFMNTVKSLAKKIIDLPSATAGNKYVAVYNETSLATEKFNLTDALDGLNALNDGIIELRNITRSGNTFTFESGFKWKIGGIIYENITDIEIIIPLATENNYRTDVIALGINNDIIRIQGIESETVSVQPPTFPNTLYLCNFIIFGDTVYNPSEPIVGQDNFVRVLEIPENLLSGTGTIEQQICDYILSLQEAQRTILETDSKWNVAIVDAIIQPPTNIYSNFYNNKYL